jgi:hypothetical protein
MSIQIVVDDENTPQQGENLRAAHGENHDHQFKYINNSTYGIF